MNNFSILKCTKKIVTFFDVEVFSENPKLKTKIYVKE